MESARQRRRVEFDRHRRPDRCGSGDRAGDQGLVAHLCGEGLVATAPCVGGEERPREEGGGEHRERTADPRRRPRPARPQVAVAVGGYPTAGDRAGDHPEEEWCDHRRRREHDAVHPGLAERGGELTERERSAAQHDAEPDEEPGDEQRRHDRGERLGECRPEEDEDVDEPHVVRLPHGTDRLVDLMAEVGATLGVTGGQVPEPAPEVGAAEQGIGDHADEQQDGDQVTQAHRRLRFVRRRSSIRPASVPRRGRRASGCRCRPTRASDGSCHG